jgi:pimeloyl-ACP methyl ester carboxylesterase
VNPFFFGRSQRPLFGIHHAPKGVAARDVGVVICPPLGQEYMRTHRALRQLALQLNKSGHHVLRFDYSGTGDSAGDNTDASLDGWLDDVATAIEELKDSAGVRKVALIGIRFGASLAFIAARARSDIDVIVLWDPAVRGNEHLAELIALDPGGVPADGAGAVGVGGFALSPGFRRQIESVDLMTGATDPARRMFIVVSEERAEYHALHEHLRGAVDGRCEYRHIPSGGSWVEAEQLGAALLPQAIIQGIVSHLSQEG